MEIEVIKSFAGQGAFAVLFVWLFIDTRKDAKAREKELLGAINKNQAVIQENQKIITENQSIIERLTDKFNILENVRSDIKDIKDKFLK